MNQPFRDCVPFYFGPQSRQLFGWYYPAAPDTPRYLPAVVLCAPLGYENLCVHSTYMYLAEQLANAGFPVLRFDYDGTGDSFGRDDDPDRVRSWVASVGYAIDTVRARSRRAEVALFGIRMGATLAAVAAAERGDVADLILWSACRDGRSYLREMRALHAMHRPTSTETEDPAPALPPFEEAAGFFFMPQTVADMRTLNAATVERPPARRALLIDRDDFPADPRIGRQFEKLGTSVTSADWPGYADMMRDSEDTRIPEAAIDQIIEWLRHGDAPDSAPFTDHLPARATADVAADRLEAAEFTEEPLRCENTPGTFGILTLPRTEMPSAKPTVLLLTVGANLHIGPSRMYVTLARRLAASGYPVLRLDLPGIGDNANGIHLAGDMIYTHDGVTSVRATLDQLQATRGTQRFVLAGLCSGAFNSYKIATIDPRIVAQVLINPLIFEMRDFVYKPTKAYVSSLRTTHTLRRLVRLESDVRGVTGALWQRLSERALVKAHDVTHLDSLRRKFETRVCRDFRTISRRGTRTLFLFADTDFGVKLVTMHLGLNPWKARGLKNVQVELIPNADHIFTPKIARDQLLSRIHEYIVHLFDSTDPASPKPKV